MFIQLLSFDCFRLNCIALFSLYVFFHFYKQLYAVLCFSLNYLPAKKKKLTVAFQQLKVIFDSFYISTACTPKNGLLVGFARLYTHLPNSEIIVIK
jgi:hypothetical protein